MAIQTGGGRRRIIAEINITPLTDVALVLLVIFMVTAPLIVQTGFKVRLPQASTLSAVASSPIMITITADERIFLNNEPVSRETLRDLLKIRSGQLQDAEKTAVVQADRSVPHGTVVDILDIIRAAGIERLAISAEIRKDKP